jgi:hypothetical protein
MDIITLLDEGIHNLDPERFMHGYRQKTIMINMLKGWRIRRILMRKKCRFLK